MIKDMLSSAESRMRGAIQVLHDDLAAIRTGRAHPGLVEKLPVEYYGTPTPLMQLASISVPEPRSLMIKPFDPTGSFTTGVAGGETRFQVLCHLANVRGRDGQRADVMLKTDLPDDDLRIRSLVPLYGGAGWHERECWEMFGIAFDGHPSLRHLYLPTEFEGYPLRKDFPLLARLVKPWPGIVDVEPRPAAADEEVEPAAAE